MKQSSELFHLTEETLLDAEVAVREIYALSCLVELAHMAEIEQFNMCGYDPDICDRLIHRRIRDVAKQCHEDFEAYRAKVLGVWYEPDASEIGR